MTEHHPTYFEARNVYQRLADLLPLVDKLCFVAEHGEVVYLRKIVNDAVGEMFRLRSLACALDNNAEIVDRLRSLAMCREADRALATEAADEIARLRNALSQANTREPPK